MRELEGLWTCESATVNGRMLDGNSTKALELTLQGNQFKTQRGDDVLFDSTYSVDSSMNPPHIDMAGIGELAGKVARGIYNVNEDRLTMCYTMPGRDRPSSFASDEGSEAFLMVWRRKKE